MHEQVWKWFVEEPEQYYGIYKAKERYICWCGVLSSTVWFYRRGNKVIDCNVRLEIMTFDVRHSRQRGCGSLWSSLTVLYVDSDNLLCTQNNFFALSNVEKEMCWISLFHTEHVSATSSSIHVRYTELVLMRSAQWMWFLAFRFFISIFWQILMM